MSDVTEEEKVLQDAVEVEQEQAELQEPQVLPAETKQLDMFENAPGMKSFEKKIAKGKKVTQQDAFRALMEMRQLVNLLMTGQQKLGSMTINLDKATPSWGSRIKCVQRHGYSSRFWVNSSKALKTRCDIDHLPFGKGHNGFLDIIALTRQAAKPLDLTLDANGVHGSHFDLEQAFNGFLDHWLRCIQGDLKNNLIIL